MQPSRDQRGCVSFFSFVYVIRFVDPWPAVVDTRKMSLWRRASFQSGMDSV